jgi:hypothetical protein
MHQRAKLSIPYVISLRDLAEVVQSNGIRPPRWTSCASMGFVARHMNADRYTAM